MNFPLRSKLIDRAFELAHAKRLAVGALLKLVLRRMTAVLLLLVTSGTIYIFWWYLRLFVCWAEVDGLTCYLCNYDIALIGISVFLVLLAIYCLIAPFRSWHFASPTNNRKQRNIGALLLVVVLFLVWFQIFALSIRFPALANGLLSFLDESPCAPH